jgi:hypothetical protein
MRGAGRSVVFSDDKKRKFMAFSALEMAVESATRFDNCDSKTFEAKTLRATKILAEHVGSFGIEMDARKGTVRYLSSAVSDTVTEACQEAETSAGRMLRIIRELNGEDDRVRILEGENLQDVFNRIIGGEFETLTCRGSVAISHKRGTNDVNAFSLLTVTKESIGKIDLTRLFSLIRDLETDVSYVIRVTAQSVYDENSLIDGVGQSQIWIFSSYFVVNEKNSSTVQEAAHRLKNSIESLTRAGVLRIEKGSKAIREVGSILARSPIGKKLLLSNNQFIAHVYPKAR